ncbi:MAG: hypothetical protein RL199_928 [Pseudomonadota bacterium]|jgi:hypothetical protein
MRIRPFSLLAAGAAAGGLLNAASAEEAAAPPADGVKFEGLVDAFYGHRFGSSQPATDSSFRAYDADNDSFTLNFAKFALDARKGAAALRFDVGFGHVAEVNRQLRDRDGTPDEAAKALQQAYAALDLGKGWQLDAGKFVTWAGSEVIEAKDNANYSRSYLFTYGPYTHTGARLTVPVPGPFTLKLAAVNGWDVARAYNQTSTVGATAGWTGAGATTVALTTYQGPEQTKDWRQYYDLVVAHPVTEAVSLNLNAAVGRQAGKGWHGASVIANWKASKTCRLAARAEHFDDREGLRLGTPAVIDAVTLTSGYAVGNNAELRIEARGDFADRAAFEAGSSRRQVTGQVAALAWF